jgi:hypothetical protein
MCLRVGPSFMMVLRRWMGSDYMLNIFVSVRVHCNVSKSN